MTKLKETEIERKKTKPNKIKRGCEGIGSSVIVCRGFALGNPQVVLKQMEKSRRQDDHS